MKKETINSEGINTIKPKGLGIRTGLFLMVLVILIVVGLYFGLNNVNATPTMEPVSISGYFIDVNGDGRLDYVVSSEVIINTGNLTLSP